MFRRGWPSIAKQSPDVLHRMGGAQATGSTEKEAEHNLKIKLAQRTGAGDGELTGDSSFPQLVRVWLDDMDLEGRLAPTTRELNMRNLVWPAFEHFTLREITVGKVDRLLKSLAVKSHSGAEQGYQDPLAME